MLRVSPRCCGSVCISTRISVTNLSHKGARCRLDRRCGPRCPALLMKWPPSQHRRQLLCRLAPANSLFHASQPSHPSVFGHVWGSMVHHADCYAVGLEQAPCWQPAGRCRGLSRAVPQPWHAEHGVRAVQGRERGLRRRRRRRSGATAASARAGHRCRRRRRRWRPRRTSRHHHWSTSSRCRTATAHCSS